MDAFGSSNSPVGSEPRILLTGATGLLGNHLLRTLNGQGHVPRILLRPAASRRPLEGLACEVRSGDLLDPSSLTGACEDVSIVYHAAAEVRIGRNRPDLFRSINVEATCRLADAARAAGARLVFISSADTLRGGTAAAPADETAPFDSRHASPYSESKHEAEQALIERARQGLDLIIIHPVFLLGPYDWKPSSGAMLLAVARGLGRIAPRGEFSIADVRDVARAIVAAGETGKSGQRYLLAGPTFTYREAWKRFAALSGRRPPLVTLGPLATVLAGFAGDALARILANEPAFNSAALRTARMPRHYTSAKAIAELDYHCRPFEETLADAWEWMRREWAM